MRNLLLHIIYIGMLLLAGCEGNEPEVSVSDDAASLEITFSVPEISISTKGLGDPWDEDLSVWTAWDRFTDGRDLYQVTILLIEEATGNLVGFRDMYASSVYNDEYNGFWDGYDVMEEETKTGKSAKVSFLYDKPQEGRTIEKLRRGRYQILAVGNYRQISAEITGAGAYNGLKGAIGSSLTIDTQFTELIDNIRNSFDPKKGIPDFKNTTMYSDIWTFNIVTDDNHLCHKQPQPLTAVRYIELTPGLNKVDIGLERTYVRVRVEIENNSGQETLKVNDFDFCDWFTQRAVYLFNDPTDNSRNYDISASGLNTYKKSPILEKECDGRVSGVPGDKPDSYKYQGNAIVSFKESIDIAPGESKVIFDGYVFGSKLGTDAGDGQTYQYSLDVEYKDKYYTKPAKLGSTEPIKTIDKLEPFTNYIIKAVRNPGFLFIKEDILYSSDSDDIGILGITDGDMTYVWNLEPQGSIDNSYFIKNLKENRYIGTPSGNQLVKTDLFKYDNGYFTFSDMTGGIQLLSTNGQYLNHYNHTENNSYGLYGFCGYHVSGDGGNPLVFYPIIGGASLPARFNENIDLKLIDPETAAVYPVTNIKRNDFINVLVSVAYNESGSRFDITSVTGWERKNEDIEFH